MALIRSARSAVTFLRLSSSKFSSLAPQNSGLKCLISGSCESTSWTHLDMNSRHSTFVKLKESYIFKLLPIMIRERGFAKVSAAPQLQRQIGMKLYMGSPGVVFDPYKPPAPLPFLQRWFTKEGWKRKKESFLHEVKTAYTIAKLRQKSGYNRKKFYTEAGDLYKEINTALAQGNRTILRQLVTENMFTIMKKELKQREGVWAHVHWEAVGPLKKIHTLQGRLASADPKNLESGFVQLTLKIHCNQIFAAYDKHGKLVAGDRSKEILVEDIWVFESALGQADKGWRLCARITS